MISNTKNSQDLREEVDYGIDIKGLPVIMIYPELNEKVDICCLNKVSKRVVDLWDRLPVFRDNMEKVAAQEGINNQCASECRFHSAKYDEAGAYLQT